MFPVLFSIGKLSVSSFGVFLALGFLFGIFLVWRLCRGWDLDEEKILDLTLLTFIGGIVGSRAYFAVENWQSFVASPLDLILINKVPGFSFWGGILAGWLTLFFLTKRWRMDFLLLADIAVVGLMGGLVLADVGCFLGGCNVGIPSKAFFAVTMVGFLGKRWPVQAAEALFLTVSLIRIWSQAMRFHARGKIVSLGLIYTGIILLILEPFKQNQSRGILPVTLILLGLVIFYKVTKQNPRTHLRHLVVFLIKFISDPETRRGVMQALTKSWYNQKTVIAWKLRNLKKLLRRSNVKFS